MKGRKVSTLRKFLIISTAILAVLLAAALTLWLARARLAAELAQRYFRQHGIASSVGFDRLSLSGLSGRVVLGPADAPDFSADAVEVSFDPLSLTPRIVAVRLINPMVRARVDEAGHVTLPSLQAWLDSLSTGEQHSRYVSDDLAVTLSHLRALLATPAGAVELDGDAKLVRSEIVSAALTAKPATLVYQGATIRLSGGGLTLDTIANGYGLTAHFEGALKTPALEATEVTAQLSAPRLRWDLKEKSFAASALHLTLHAARLESGGLVAANPAADVTAQAVAVALVNGAPEGSADLRLQAGADFSPPGFAARYPILAREPRLVNALTANLKHLDLALNAGIARRNGALNFSLKQPMAIEGAKDAVLRVNAFALTGTPANLHGTLNAALSGAGLPSLSLSSRDFHWQDGGLVGDAALRAHFDFAMLHGADMALGGNASFRNGVFAFDQGSCAPATLRAFHPGDSDLAQAIKGSLCAAPGAKTFTADKNGWNLSATARDTAMVLPLGNVQLDGGAGRIAFSGKGAFMNGKIAVTAARLTDRVAPRRFEPITATGDIALDDWIWHGAFAVSDSGGALGTASFSHVLATGSGELKIAAPQLQFAPGKFQPAMLSPLLGPVSRAEGIARFDGVISWKGSAVQSHGTLALDKLDFLTPLGTAHAINATIVLSSLLPPVTAPGQHITVSRIDWTLPLSGIALDFSFGNGALKVESLRSDIADGNVRLGAFTINLAAPGNITGAAGLEGISLAPLVAASNLGSKIKLEGKVSGNVPFTYGADGFRIVNGHIAALGPGRISLDRSVWNQGGAVAVNAVQDLAYQALEYLAYDQLSTDINSVAGGRLQVVFHIKGRSDPPRPQQAEVAVADIINGSALQKPIALPSGTPIDLTLDTSLNFDELLKSYGEAWSKTLAQTGQSN